MPYHFCCTIFQITLTLACCSSKLLNDSFNECVKYNAYIYIYREKIIHTFFHIKPCISPRHQYQSEGGRPEGCYWSKVDTWFNMENGMYCYVYYILRNNISKTLSMPKFTEYVITHKLSEALFCGVCILALNFTAVSQMQKPCI